MAAASQGGHFINKGALHSFEMDTAGDNLSLSSVRCIRVYVCGHRPQGESGWPCC